MFKKVLINILKVSLALGILAWLVQNGKLEPKSILKLFSNYNVLFSAILLYLIQFFIGAKRWQSILMLKSESITDTKRILLISWIGQFFSSALPGAVTGDLIKLNYVKKMDRKLSTQFLILSVFLDRLMGLLGLLLISGISNIIFYNYLVGLSPEMPKIMLINLLLLVCGLIGISLFLLPHSVIDIVKNFINIKLINNALDKFKSIQINKVTLAKLLLFSSLAHFLSILTFHLINNSSYQSLVQIKDLLAIIPIGLIAIAIPISPAGLGVGHLAFQKLFSFIHQSNGATLFNNFWIIYLTLNLIGFIPYIFLKHQIKEE